MEEMRAGKRSIYEKEVRDLMARLKCQGVILIVIDGSEPDGDRYEVASAITGGPKAAMRIPLFLMNLAQKFADDIKTFVQPPGRTH